MAYKVAILDDEVLIREGIQLKYPFQEKGYKIVYSSENGHDLLNKMELGELRPDVIFVDILMPKLNGLEFIKKLREMTDDEIVIIIVSGHDEFDYARKAIQLNVTAYLLKPLNPVELDRVMNKITDQLTIISINQKERRHEEISDWLYANNQDRKLSSAGEELLQRLMFAKPNLYVVLFGNLQSMSAEYQMIRPIFTDEGDFEISSFREMNLFVHFDSDEFFHEKIFSEVDLKTITIMQFTGLHSLGDVLRCVSYGLKWIRHHLILERRMYKKLKCSSKLDLDVFKSSTDYMAQLQKFENLKQQKGSIEALKVLISEPIPQRLKETAIQQFARDFLQIEISDEWLQQFDQMQQFIDECMYLMQKYSNSIKPVKGKEIIKSVVKDLEVEYFKNLSIQDYADRYHIHPNYLVRLFKQEFGTTFYQTLMKIRMEKAEQALAESNRKIADIAAEIGYEDARYFSQVFRKFKKMTPNEYRKLCQEG